MTKTIFLFMMSLGMFIATAIAQPILTSANTNPTAGEIFGIYSVDYEFQGSPGDFETWDFSGLTVGNINNYVFALPSATPHNATFAGSANLCNIYLGANYDYYSATSSAYSRVGFATQSGVVALYSNAQDQLRFPFEYNDTYTDNFSVTFTNQGTTFNRAGTITVTADGHGTLILPDGTLTDVLRVHVVEDYVDNYTLGGVPNTINYYSDIYLWYKPGTHFPVLAFTDLTSDISSNQYGVYHYPGTVGIDEQENKNISVTVMPNPASQMANVTLNLLKQENVHIALVNALGQTVVSLEETTLQPGTHQLPLNIQALPGGIYFVNVKTENGISNQRLLIQH
jgi:hypothetical protein